jgi:hypothetical protein
LPGEEQSERKPTEENETERCNDANDIDFGLTEGEQGASYAEQEQESDNDISTDDDDGKKPKLRTGERKSVHTLVCMHSFTDVNQ